MIGTKVAHYEIKSHLGSGGMGDVYEAIDSKLGRRVAVKFLPEAFARDTDRVTRFEREARVLASLNHPHIAAIYGLEQTANQTFLVMELVDGETLAERIARGAIPLDEALPIAKQIAEALEMAHERGIIHRDLKPANIMLTADGKVKVLDFGLAKAYVQDQPSAVLSNSPTMAGIAATNAGVILGTAAYMSPEQARGKDVGKRADIWAFGVVLYEMLTGKRLFQGEDLTETLASVVKDQPDLSVVPPSVRRLLSKCLEKDPKKRLRDISGVELLLLDETPAAQAADPASAAGQARLLPWAVAAIFALSFAALAIVHFRQPVPEPQALQFAVALPENSGVQQFAVSPDGRYLVMAVTGEHAQLMLRSLDSLKTKPLPDTEGAVYPFWSPDGRYIGFFANDKLKKIAVTGGPPQILCDAPVSRGGAWSRDGVIVFAASNGDMGLSRVPQAGGMPITFTKPENGSHRLPSFLPDGRRFLYVRYAGKDPGIYLASLDPGKETRLLPDASAARYVPPSSASRDGHILFVRDQTLIAQPVDPTSLEIKGDVFPVAPQVGLSLNGGNYLFSTSLNGMLIYQTGAVVNGRQAAWFDRGGKLLSTVGGPVLAPGFALSRDGKRLVVPRATALSGAHDLWISDERNIESRFTFDTQQNLFPVWSPDGSRIAYGSTRLAGVSNIYQKASNNTGKDELLLQAPTANFPWDWSHDGKFIIFTNVDPKTKDDLWALPVSQTGATPENGGDKKPISLIQSPFNEWFGQVSPDGRWLAYVSDESGRFEVYVQPFAPGSAKPAAGKWQVSTAGGSQPRWREDGNELFYAATDRKLMAVDVKASAATFERGTPQALFSLSFDPAASRDQYRYAPRPDGKQFLTLTDGEFSNAASLTVHTSWLAGSKK